MSAQRRIWDKQASPKATPDMKTFFEMGSIESSIIIKEKT